MSGIKTLLRPGHRWKAVLLVVLACAGLLAGGLLIGYATGRKKAAAGQQSVGQLEAGSMKLQQQLMHAGQLPFPGSAAAVQLLADPSVPGWLRDLYTHQQDSNLITAEHTAALLKQLQRAMQSLPASSQSTAQANIAKPVLSPTLVTASVTSLPAAAAAASVQQHLELLSAYQSSLTVNPSSISSSSSSSSSSSTSSNPATDLQPFIAAACDVLSYLRHKQSQALLPMLRDYSSSGSKGLAAVASNPAVLRQEVQQLLQPASLQQWYVEAARSRVDAGARPTVRESTAVVLAFDTAPVRHSRRRLVAASADAPGFDLTSALLSKMQGLSSVTPASILASSPTTATRLTKGSASAPAAAAPAASVAPLTQPSALSGAATEPAMPASSSMSGIAGWVPAKPAPVPVVLAGGVGASAIAEPDYLAFDFEDLGAEGDTFADQDADLASSGSSSSSSSGSNWKGGRVRKQPGNAQTGRRAGGSVSKGSSTAALSQGSKWVSLQVADDAATPPAEPVAAAATPAAGTDQQQQQQQQPQTVPQAPQQQAVRSDVVAVPQAGVHVSSDDSAALCGIQQFSPLGLQRIADPVMCPAPRLSYYSQGGWVFRPITIPVIFHCLAFTRVLPSYVSPAGVLGVEGPDAQVLLPPSWQASAAAGNLIDQANKAFTNTGIQFKLQEVRHDPTQHSYLQQPNLEAWQSCTYNAAEPAAGVTCLSNIARHVGAAASPLAVHVFVAGSRDERAYCDTDAAAMGSVCRSVAPGYSRARGPWMGHLASLTWKEDALADNYLFLSWDTFNPATANSVRFANRGGSIFAAQLAQHLGVNPSAAAATAAGSSCITQQQIPALAAWCSHFRQGRQPPMSELLAASSCPGSSFNILEPSVPSSCAMSFTGQQAAALQAAVAMYRPQLHAAFAAN